MSPLAYYFESEYLIDSRSVDHMGHCRPSAMLGFLQETATRACTELHISGPEMRGKYHGFWMVARIRYELTRPLAWNERINIRTWHRPTKGAAVHRDFSMTDAGGQAVGQATSTWVLADVETYKLIRLSQITEMEGKDGGTLCGTELLGKLRLPDEMQRGEERLLRYSETDINGHVNNTHYADYVCDALHFENLRQGQYISAVQLGYQAQCHCGETLTLYTAQCGNEYYVRGDGREGTPRFDASLTVLSR